MSVETSVAEIRKILGQGGFIDQPVEMQAYVTSWRNGWAGRSPLIALPSSTQQVAEIVGICHRNKIPMVPQGGNTGLVDGGVPSTEGNQIVINLSRMNKVRELDVASSTMTVEAGMILQNAQETAAKAGFLFPLSMASQGSAEIGGAISTNAGGTAVLRYGNMRELVMGIEAVLPDGKIMAGLKKLPKDNTGYNLAHYFIGTEGTLGIITAATLRLFPELKQNLTAVMAIPDAAVALELLNAFRRECGEYLSAFEIMSHAALELVTRHIAGTRFPGRDDAPFYLLLELGSSSQNVPLRNLFEELASAALEKGQILDAVLAENTTQSKQFWYLREHIPEALRKEKTRIHFDISLPLPQIAGFLKNTEGLIKKVAPDVQPIPFGHIGDGNIHYNMYFREARTDDGFSTMKKKVRQIVFDEVNRLQGSISAEHGIGLERKAELKIYKAPLQIELMRKIKKSMDPDNLMNPGKIFDL